MHYYEQFFYIFPDLFFSETNNVKIIPLILFYQSWVITS